MSRKPTGLAALSGSAAIVAFALSTPIAAAQDPAPTAGQRVGNAVDRVKQGV